jgi:hypothetical protein
MWNIGQLIGKKSPQHLSSYRWHNASADFTQVVGLYGAKIEVTTVLYFQPHHNSKKKRKFKKQFLYSLFRKQEKNATHHSKITKKVTINHSER